MSSFHRLFGTFGNKPPTKNVADAELARHADCTTGFTGVRETGTNSYAYSTLHIPGGLVRLVSPSQFGRGEAAWQRAAQHRHFVCERWEELWRLHKGDFLSVCGSDVGNARLLAHAAAEAQAWGLYAAHPWAEIRWKELIHMLSLIHI